MFCRSLKIMHEYELSILVANNGLALFTQPLGSTGSEPYISFPSWFELREFLRSLELSEDLIAQFDAMAETAETGIVFKQRMFLPEAVDRYIAQKAAAISSAA